MKRQNYLLFVPSILGVGGVVGLIVPTQASTITVGPVTVEPYLMNISTKTDWSGNLTLAQFDPAKGNLTGIELQLSCSLNTNITVTSTENPGVSSSGTDQTEVQISIQDASGYLNPGESIDPQLGYSDPQLDIYAAEHDYTVGGGNTTILTAQALNQTYDSATADPSNYPTGYNLTSPGWAILKSEFTGTGSITLPVGTWTHTWIDQVSGNVDNQQSTYAGVTGAVIYTYNVPEPGTVGLVVIGGAMSMFRRRHTVRFQKAKII